MTNVHIRALANEFSTWIRERCILGILPADAYDEMLERMGLLLWSAFERKEETAKASPGLCSILALLEISPEHYQQKWLIGRRASSNGHCGYWPPLAGDFLSDKGKLSQLQEALKNLQREFE